MCRTSRSRLPVIQAFLAAEDRNFFNHGGIDVGGPGPGHVQEHLQTPRRGDRLEGGSTITQQVAKNVLLTNESEHQPQGQGSDPGQPA